MDPHQVRTNDSLLPRPQDRESVARAWAGPRVAACRAYGPNRKVSAARPPSPSPTGGKAMADQLGIGIIGASHSSASHLNGLGGTLEAFCRGIVDLVGEKATARATEFKVPDKGTDYRVLLDDPGSTHRRGVSLGGGERLTRRRTGSGPRRGFRRPRRGPTGRGGVRVPASSAWLGGTPRPGSPGWPWPGRSTPRSCPSPAGARSRSG